MCTQESRSSIAGAKIEQKVSSLTQRSKSERRLAGCITLSARVGVHRKFSARFNEKVAEAAACTGVEGAACGVAYIALAVSMNRQRSVHRWISARSFSVCRSELYKLYRRQQQWPCNMYQCACRHLLLAAK